MSTQDTNETQTPGWAQADRAVSGLILLAGLGFIAGAVVGLWI